MRLLGGSLRSSFLGVKRWNRRYFVLDDYHMVQYRHRGKSNKGNVDRGFIFIAFVEIFSLSRC